MTTKADVLLIAPELATVSDDLFNLVLADASREVSSSSVGRYASEAQRYLTAHILTLLNSAGAEAGASGFVESMKTGDVSLSYATAKGAISGRITRYDATIYGQRYILLLRRKIIPAVVY